MINLFNKNLKSEEYLELKKTLEALKIEVHSLKLDFELIVKKLKFKYKINYGDDKTEDIKTSVLLPDNGNI